MKLYTHTPSPNCIKVAAAAQYLGIPLESVEMEPHSQQCKTPEYLAKNPNGLVPTLEDGELVVWESNAILVHLAQKAGNSAFLPTDPTSQVELWRWMSWGMCHWAPTLRVFMYEHMVQPLIHHQPGDEAAVARAEKTFHGLAGILESQLQGRNFLLGEQVTVADFSLGPYLIYHGLARIPMADYPNLSAWYERLTQLPGWPKPEV